MGAWDPACLVNKMADPPCKWETDFQWETRKAFIKACSGNLPKSRVEALSMVYSNIKFLGCKYPPEISSVVLEIESRASLNIPAKTFRTVKVLIPKLTIYEPAENEKNVHPVTILNESCQKSLKTIDFQDLGSKELEGQVVYSCSVSICDKLIATDSGTSRKSAKKNVAEKALDILRSCQPTKKKITPRISADDDTLEIKKNDLVAGACLETPAISDDNIGNQMLRKMGWKGSGGVGKREQGRDTPVMSSGKLDKSGLGKKVDVCDAIDINSLKNHIMKFISDHSRESIRFSPNLSKDERAFIHGLVRRYKLKSRSFGKDDNRYLVVYKKI